MHAISPVFFKFTSSTMEEIINTFDQRGTPKQPIRITYKGHDFQVRILEKELHKNINEITLLLDGMVQKLKKHQDRWYFENSEEDKDFANDIGRAISLRYRL